MQHTHDAVVHTHEHAHVVHYLRHGTQWEHMAATHSHEHSHPALDHDHEPHVNAGEEHLRQAHIHDHAHPASSGPVPVTWPHTRKAPLSRPRAPGLAER